MHKQIFNDATQVFKNPTMQEDKVDQQSSKMNELLHFLSQEDVAHQLINLLNMLKYQTQVDTPIKNVCKLNHMDKSFFDP